MGTMPLIRLPASNHRAQPWKNGLGVSHTIADFPAGAGFDAVHWQVGSTGIGGDCPFSLLPGLDRQFTVVEGAGVELSSDDEAGRRYVQQVKPFAPYAFRGDWGTECRLLDGPVKVFNVMTRRGKFDAAITLAVDPGMARNARDEILVAVELQTLEAWRLEGEPAEAALPAGRYALVRIRALT